MHIRIVEFRPVFRLPQSVLATIHVLPTAKHGHRATSPLSDATCATQGHKMAMAPRGGASFGIGRALPE